ncbi:MAG: hypothetical protein WD794_01405 [Mycobacteriales bacterium]
MTAPPHDIGFLPIVYRLAGRLEQLTWEELSDDVTSSTFALRSAQQLFGLPVVVSHFRLGVEGEACGARVERDSTGSITGSGTATAPLPAGQDLLDATPLAQVLEVTARLSTEFRDDVAVAGVLSGPRSLQSVLPVDAAELTQLYAVLARAYLERGARLLIVAEDPVLGVGSQQDVSLNPLLNVAGYFGAQVIVLDELPRDQVLPLDELAREPNRSWRGRPVVTDGEVPQDLPAEHLSAWLKELS